MLRRRTIYAVCIGLSVLIAATQLPRKVEKRVAAADIQITADQFAQYVNKWSEPEGFFDSDNFISNETSYLHIIGELQNRVQPGGVYIGVGPDQNFSYIAHAQPSLAIVVDIRRQNMLQHLMYKALFDLSSSRAEFLARLFARDIPQIDMQAGLPEILEAIRQAPTDDDRYATNLATLQRKIEEYRLNLNADDFSKIDYVYRTFYQESLDLRFSTLGRGNAFRYPTFEQIVLETDLFRRLQNYLSTDELFQRMKKFQAENRLIPIVGDFAGPHAFKATADFLNQRGLQVSTFYTSNVEFYLFGRPVWSQYVDNVEALPISDDAIFIRAYFSSSGPAHPKSVPGHRSTTLIHDIPAFLTSQADGDLRSYWDIVR